MKYANVKYTKEILEKFVKESTHLSDMMRKMFNGKFTGSQHQHIKRQLIEFEIDTSHWLSTKEICKLYPNKRRTSEQILGNFNIQQKGYVLKRCMLEFGIVYECSICKIVKWNNKEITLQVDHINGNNVDNNIENLRFLCPNCHSQTDTFCSKNKKIKTIDKFCCDCGKIVKKSNRCKSCGIKNSRKISSPPKNELLCDIENYNIADIAKKYNVSSVTIKTWCKNYDIWEYRKYKK